MAKLRDKIAFEEHFLLAQYERHALHLSADIKRRLLDFEGTRLEEMDRAGIRLAIVSFTSPGVQGEPDADKAVEMARRINDTLAEQVARRRDRFAGFAALPLQDPERAARELERTVQTLGFKGAMVNGYSNLGDADTGIYLDDELYLAFWQRVEQLGVPIYLHPRDALPSQQRIFDGHPELLRAAWGWGFETGTHFLRLLMSGLFDRFPRLKLVLGHMGETLPFAMYRVQNRFEFDPGGKTLQKPVMDYLRENLWVTTSGVCRTPALIDTLLELGSDRVLFSTDYPFEKMPEAGEWMDSCTISEADRRKIARDNAVGLFKLG